MKKLLAIVLSLLMVMSLAVPAMAADHTLTVTGATGDRTLNAYQIFKGDIAADGITLTNIEWGNGVDSDGLLAELKTVTEFDGIENVSTARDLADWLADLNAEDNADTVIKFSKIVAKHTVADNAEALSIPENSTDYVATVHDGYYIVVDETKGLTDEAKSLHMIRIVGDSEIKIKADKPTLDKIIDDNTDDGVKANSAAIGETVKFKLTSKVPDMLGYDKYFFVINDKMSKGLTYDKDEGVEITIGEKTLAENTDFKIYVDTTTDPENTLIKIVLLNFIDYKDNTGDAITVEYQATVNKDAVIGVEGNPNEVTLTYSNDPNVDYKGDNEPDENDPTGTTPKSKTKTFVAEFDVQKVTGTPAVELDNAKFKVTSEQFNHYIKVTQEYEQADDGSYYKLIPDNTYTNVAPTTGTMAKFEGYDADDGLDSNFVKYTLTTKSSDEITVTNNTENITIGRHTFKGVNEGIYKFEETAAPDGYNAVENPIYVYVKCILPTNEAGDLDTNSNAEWYYKVYNANETTDTVLDADGLAALTKNDLTVENGWASLDNDSTTFELKVENNKGSKLPETGGIGTTIFYVVGGLMMTVAVVLLATKKKVSGR